MMRKMLQYRLRTPHGEVILSCHSEDLDKLTELNFKGSNNAIAFVKQFLSEGYNLVGHPLYSPESNTCFIPDLYFALSEDEAVKTLIPELIEFDERIASWKLPKLPPGYKY